MSLLHYAVTRSSFQDRTHGLVLSKGGSVRHWLAAETEELVEVWQNAMNQASRSATQVKQSLNLNLINLFGII